MLSSLNSPACRSTCTCTVHVHYTNRYAPSDCTVDLQLLLLVLYCIATSRSPHSAVLVHVIQAFTSTRSRSARIFDASAPLHNSSPSFTRKNVRVHSKVHSTIQWLYSPLSHSQATASRLAASARVNSIIHEHELYSTLYSVSYEYNTVHLRTSYFHVFVISLVRQTHYCTAQ